MSNGQVLTTLARKIIMHRAFEVSPSYTAPTQFRVGTGTTTPTVGDVDLETPILIGGSFSKDIVVGYPVFDDGSMIATIRCLLLTTECNGNTLTEFGLVNTDGPSLLFSRCVFTGIAKNSNIQVIFLEKDQIQQG